MIWGEPRRNPWIDPESFKRNGALVFAESREEYNAYMSGCQQKAAPPEEIVLQFENILGKKGRKRFITVFCGENGYDEKNYQYRDFGI